MERKRVLIVEDNFDNRVIYSEILRHGGFEVAEAQDGAEGVVRALELRPDLILMDLSMPVMDGWKAVAALRADDRTSRIPVLALSAHVLFEGDYERAREAGFVDYLTKPIEPKRVLEAVIDTIGVP